MRALGAVLAIVAVLATACTSSKPVASISPSPSPSPSPAGPKLLCFSDAPPDWSSAIARPIATLNGVNFGPGAVDDPGQVVYGYFDKGFEKGVAAVNLATGRMSTVSLMTPKQSGVAWMTYSDGWLVWAQGESTTVLGQWSIQIWNSRTHQKREIATSRLTDGSYLTGELVFPVAGHGYVAWNQPVNEESADVRVYQLASGKTIVLDSGKVSSPVLAGDYLVWAKLEANAEHPSFVFANAATLEKADVPSGLGDPREIGYLAGSSDYLVWTGTPVALSPDNGSLFVEALSTGTVTEFGARDHYFQFPIIAGPYLVWFGAVKSSVVDLRSGSGFDVPIAQSVGAAGDTLVVTALTGSGTKGSIGSTRVSVLHPSQLQPLGTCQV